jgi:hypothetical protein
MKRTYQGQPSLKNITYSYICTPFHHVLILLQKNFLSAVDLLEICDFFPLKQKRDQIFGHVYFVFLINIFSI